MKEENKKGNSVLLTIVAVATLLVIVIGVSFAYFTASVSGNDTASSVIVKTAEIGTITYTNGQALVLENGYPGAYSNTITFTVSSSAASGGVATQYILMWASVTNDFVDKSDLEYTISSNDAGTITGTFTAPSTAGRIGTQSAILPAGATHTYTMQLHFKETGNNQNSNQGKNFSGVVQVATTDAVDSDLYYTDHAPSGTTDLPSAY